MKPPLTIPENSFGGIEVTQVWFDEMISWEKHMTEEKKDPNLTVPVPDYPPGTPKEEIREIDPEKPKKKGK